MIYKCFEGSPSLKLNIRGRESGIKSGETCSAEVEVSSKVEVECADLEETRRMLHNRDKQMH